MTEVSYEDRSPIKMATSDDLPVIQIIKGGTTDSCYDLVRAYQCGRPVHQLDDCLHPINPTHKYTLVVFMIRERMKEASVIA